MEKSEKKVKPVKKKLITNIVKKAVKQYAETFKLLAGE